MLVSTLVCNLLFSAVRMDGSEPNVSTAKHRVYITKQSSICTDFCV